jgi:type IV pilus assembly protein PilX
MSLVQRQRGISLMIVLVVLTISLVGSLSLLRSSEVSALIAGNVSFREAATQATDIGISEAAKALSTMANFDTNVANVYFATRQPEDSHGLPTSVTWSSVPSVTVGYYSVQHVVERLCQTTPVTDPAADCMVRDGEAAGSSKAGSLVYKNPASVYYRITVRVAGPKSTSAFVQALVVK